MRWLGIDVADWEASGKRAAVVRIESVAEPPCVTTGGQLYERVSGETIPVADPGDVRALYDRGRAAAERAEASARRAVDAVCAGSLEGEHLGPFLILALAVAPVGTARDIAAQVFAPSVEPRLLTAADRLPSEPLFPEYGHHLDRFGSTYVRQDAVVVETNPSLVHLWRLRVAWDGSAAGLLRVGPHQETSEGTVYAEYETVLIDPVFDDALRPLAGIVEETARDIGGHGRAHVVLSALASNFSLHHGGRVEEIPDMAELRPIQRWAEGGPGSTTRCSRA